MGMRIISMDIYSNRVEKLNEFYSMDGGNKNITKELK